MKRVAALKVTFKLLNFSTYNNCSKTLIVENGKPKSLTLLLANVMIAGT